MVWLKHSKGRGHPRHQAGERDRCCFERWAADASAAALAWRQYCLELASPAAIRNFVMDTNSFSACKTILGISCGFLKVSCKDLMEKEPRASC